MTENFFGCIIRLVGTLNKIILKTALYSFAGAFIFFSYVLVIVGHVFPATMAGWAESLGATGASAMYRERVYNSNKTPENYYLMLDKFVVTGDSAKIIKYAPGFFVLPEYEDIIDQVNDFKYSKAVLELEKKLGCNEDDRFRRALLGAYLKKGRIDDATQVFKEAISVENTKLGQPSYAFLALGNEELLDEFEEYFTRYMDLYGDGTALSEREKFVADHFVERIKILYGEDFGDDA